MTNEINKNDMSKLRYHSRKLIRELGMLELNMSRSNRTPQHWHALIEIANEPNITITQLGRMLLLSASSISRIVTALLEEKLITIHLGADKREKYLQVSQKGALEIKNIDEFSHIKIKGAFQLLNNEDQNQIIVAIERYADALEKSRLLREQVKINTLSTSRIIRKQIMSMIENIQKNEFNLPITSDINICVLKAENDFYFNQSYNFWYATDANGNLIGSIGLKKIDNKNAEIKKFFVSKEYRGKGVSIKLLHSLLKAAIKHKFKTLYLGTVSSLVAAQRFYEKYGFQRIKESQLPDQIIKCPLDTVFFKGKLNDIQRIVTMQIEEGIE